ncbi:MAG: hypothetical protein MR639_02470 [Clostridium sp.]|uniref:hypothetical protein n=1 Tax=Clostridium sp. TaxID=1506 RepID=UPI002A8AF9B6|nr:hypothetical protein [Clostridium sp.]MDY5097216.1 hypothetical protein [Clostridium sp.]
MESQEILSPGKKIRKIRKSFKINQEDITGGEITRNLISIIENDKANLTSKVAVILSENINRVCKEKGIDFNVTSEYLLEDVESQAKKIADKYILDLKNDFLSLSRLNKVSIDIEKFLMSYPIYDKKAEIYCLIGDLYFKFDDFYKANNFYLKAYENILQENDLKELTNVLYKLSASSFSNHNYDDVLTYINLALVNINLLTYETIYNLYISSIKSCIYLDKLDEALNEISFVEDTLSSYFLKNSDKKLSLLKLKAKCLKKKRFFNDTLKIEKKILSSLRKDNIEDKLLAISSMLEIYVFTKDFKNVQNSLKLNEAILEEYCDMATTAKSAEIFTSFAEFYSFINDTSSATKLFDLATSACRNNLDDSTIVLILSKYLDFLISNNCYDKIAFLKTEVLTLISLKKLTKTNELIFKFLKYYSVSQDIDSLNSLLGFLTE